MGSWISLGATGLGMAAALLGCSGQKETPPEGTSGDTAADSAADTGTAPAPAPNAGLLLRLGQATVDANGYSGVEEWTFTGDSGYGELLCHIRYDLVQTAVRTDCAPCLWAFDLSIAGAQVLLDEQGACQTALSVDAATVGSWDGTVRSYGYNPDFFGHAQVLMVYEDGAWDGGTYAEFDEATGELRYEWLDGEVTY